MEIEFLIPRTGAVTHNVGDRADVPEAEAKRLIEAGKARPVAAKPATGRRKKAVQDADEVR